ncbi:MAG: thiol peroxidase [Chlamydiales bacterium]|nr:thiol peroxidase [Chlamydiales bacterium]
MAKITLKGNPVHTSGELPAQGSVAVDFLLTDSSLKDRSLKEFQGKRKLISIVPSLDTPVCSLSTKKFNETAKKHPEVVFMVVSADLPFAQKRACETEKVENVLTLSMMRSKDFAKNYGVLLVDGPLAGITARAVLVLDEKNKVVYRELVPEIAQEPDYDKAIKALLS